MYSAAFKMHRGFVKQMVFNGSEYSDRLSEHELFRAEVNNHVGLLSFVLRHYLLQQSRV